MDPESLAKGNLYKVNTTKAQHDADIAASRLAYRRRLATMGLAPETEFALGASELTNPTQNIDTVHRGTAGRIITNPVSTPQDLARASQLQGNAPNQTTYNMERGIAPRQELQVVDDANGNRYIVDQSGVPQLWDKKVPGPLIVPGDGKVLERVLGPDGTYREVQTIKAVEKDPSWTELSRAVAMADKQTLGSNFPDVATYIQQRLGILGPDGQLLAGKKPLNPYELDRAVARINELVQSRRALLPSVNYALEELGLRQQDLQTKEWDNTWFDTEDERDNADTVLPNLGGEFMTSKGFRWDAANKRPVDIIGDSVPVPLQSVAELGGGISEAMAQVSNPMVAKPLPPDYASNPANAGKFFYVKDGDVKRFVKVVLTNEGIKLVERKKAGQ
jgi:hypothetical protein